MQLDGADPGDGQQVLGQGRQLLRRRGPGPQFDPVRSTLLTGDTGDGRVRQPALTAPNTPTRASPAMVSRTSWPRRRGNTARTPAFSPAGTARASTAAITAGP